MLWFLLFTLAHGSPAWVDLSEVDSSIALDRERFPAQRGRRHLADSCWLRHPVAVGLHRANSQLRLERRRLSVRRCYVPSRKPCSPPCASKEALATGGVVELVLLDGLGQEIRPYPQTEDRRLDRVMKGEGFTRLGSGMYRYQTPFPGVNLPYADLTNRDKAAERLSPISR